MPRSGNKSKKKNISLKSKEADVETSIINDTRFVKPYVYSFNTFAKGRWFGRSVLDVVTSEFGSHPLSYWKRAITLGFVTINNNTIDSNYIFKNGDSFIHKAHRHEPPVICDISLVADTSDVLAVSKPSSMPVHPCGAYRHNSLTKILESSPLIENQPQLYLVHRLDRLTSGVVVLGKSHKSASLLSSQIRDKTTSKVYIARVKGKFPNNKIIEQLKFINNEEDLLKLSETSMDNINNVNDNDNTNTNNAKRKLEEIDDNKDEDPKDNRKNIDFDPSTSHLKVTKLPTFEEIISSDDVGIGIIDISSKAQASSLIDHHSDFRLNDINYLSNSALVLRCPTGAVSFREGVYTCLPSNASGAKDSVSLFRPLGKYDEKSDTTLIECRPISGRTHQLRLHLEFLGTPIANDPCYGGELFFEDKNRLDSAISFMKELNKRGLKPLAKVKHLDKYIDNNNSNNDNDIDLIRHEGECDDAFIGRSCAYCRARENVKTSFNNDNKTDNLSQMDGMYAESILHSDGIWLHALMYDGAGWGPFESSLPQWATKLLDK